MRRHGVQASATRRLADPARHARGAYRRAEAEAILSAGRARGARSTLASTPAAAVRPAGHARRGGMAQRRRVGSIARGKGRKLARDQRRDSDARAAADRPARPMTACGGCTPQMLAIAGGEQVDGRRIAGLERRAAALAEARSAAPSAWPARSPDPAPVLRRVEDLEHQRAASCGRSTNARPTAGTARRPASITLDQVRSLLRRLFAEIARGMLDRRRTQRNARGTAINESSNALSSIPPPPPPGCTTHFSSGAAGG